MRKLFFYTIIALFLIIEAQAEEINFGVSISTSAQREAFYTLATQFELANPGTKIHFTALTSELYKDTFPKLLTEENQYDVLYWHAGQRLFEFATAGLISPITDVWHQHNLDTIFDDSVVNTLKMDQQIYALPISYYQIGFYYSKPIFAQLDLQEPKNWQELMQVCDAIKGIGVPPIFIGTASNWPATAWFDYLNIRINGLVFHQALTQGKVDFTDPRVGKVFETWLEPIEAGCFIAEHEKMSWREGLPFLYRDLVGMSMIGNYVVQDVPASVVDKLGFFPFPLVGDSDVYHEEAPIDVLLIPQNAKNKLLAKRFLIFLSQAHVQSNLNEMLGVISPHNRAQTQTLPLVKEAYEVLSKASGVSQFFDRDAKKEFADKVMPILDDFMLNQNVTATQDALESVRKAVFMPAALQHRPTTNQ